MNLKLLLQIILLASFELCFSQVSSCPNSDFESGTFSGWQAGIGNCCPINTFPSGIINGRHTIMSGTGTDPNTCNAVTVVAPGGLYSARLGNDNTDSEAEKLTYSITVTPSNALFIYKYAVVLEDPDHSPEDQPRFQIRVLNSAGVLIDPTCGEYTVVSGSNIPGFQTCNGTIRYKDWTTVGLNLTAYMGQTITIEFSTGDCSLGAHFGYAYVDAYCSPLQISSTYCTGSFAAILTAPIGFSYLWNTGETTQSINVNNPNAGLTYTCILTSVTGCVVNISTVLTLFDPVATFNITNTCYSNAIFANTTALPFGTVLDHFSWDFGDGQTSTLENPTHSYTAPGTYTVTFTISNALGCSNTTTSQVTVVIAPTATFSFPSAAFCTTEVNPQSVNLTGTNSYLGGVFSATPAGLSIDSATGTITPSTSSVGTYTVSYTMPTANGCAVPPATATVTISQPPTATITYLNSPYCGNISSPQPVFLNGTGSYTGGTYTASPAGLTINSTTGAIIPSTSQTGNYVVTYTIPSLSGCSGSPITTTVVINLFPTATINYSGSPYCTSNTTDQQVVLTGTNSYAGGLFSAPAGLALNSNTGSINPSSSLPGTYTVTYTIPALQGCVFSPVSTTVVITLLPTASISYATPFCRDVTQSQAVTLTGTGAYTGGIYTSTSGLSINSTSGAIIPSTSDAGTYTITYTAPATLGCAAVPTTTVVVINPLPQPSLTDGDICFDPSGNLARSYLLDSGLTSPTYTFKWYLNGTLVPGALLSTYNATAVGNYSVVATNAATGCNSSQVFGTVISAQMASDFIASVEDTFTENNILTILVQGGTGPFFFQLDNGAIQTSNVFYSLASGVHTVSVTDSTNCTVITKEVTVLGFPKYFTPNEDGYNDFWNIYYFNNFPEAQIHIFDRYGKFLKQISPSGIGWDGTYNGESVPATDYWFTVSYNENNLQGLVERRVFKSHFSLKR